MSVSQYSPCPRCGFPDENLSGGEHKHVFESDAVAEPPSHLIQATYELDAWFRKRGSDQWEAGAAKSRRQPPATEQEWTWKTVSDIYHNPQGNLFDNIADAHNAVLAAERKVLEAERKHNEATIVELEQQLAAERETTNQWKKTLRGDITKLCEQLATERENGTRLACELCAAQVAIAEHREALEWLRDFQNGCPLPSYEKDWNHAMALTDACLKSKPDLSALEKHDAEVLRPLVDALEKMPEVAYQTIIEHAGVTLENLPNEFQSICDNALAKVKGYK